MSSALASQLQSLENELDEFRNIPEETYIENLKREVEEINKEMKKYMKENKKICTCCEKCKENKSDRIKNNLFKSIDEIINSKENSDYNKYNNHEYIHTHRVLESGGESSVDYTYDWNAKGLQMNTLVPILLVSGRAVSNKLKKSLLVSSRNKIKFQKILENSKNLYYEKNNEKILEIESLKEEISKLKKQDLQRSKKMALQLEECEIIHLKNLSLEKNNKSLSNQIEYLKLEIKRINKKTESDLCENSDESLVNQYEELKYDFGDLKRDNEYMEKSNKYFKGEIAKYKAIIKKNKLQTFFIDMTIPKVVKPRKAYVKSNPSPKKSILGSK